MPTYRVLVRGKFDRPDEPTRARLLAADQPEMAFTEEGSLSYNHHLASFGFRIVVHVEPGENAEREARDQAELRAMELLEEQRYPYRDLGSTATCMDDIKINRRGR
ncbi:DUF6204 family protein [Amycolatopsis sp. NPDC059027]|uniref:DUF6204 family protein n=1 Tax=Amycolatopsis sp. NPDC059027 TaxID=3346709 RepID=UPI00366B2AFD